ncbi:MAG: WecB/TagA/CpsF family glycosyltransferase [Anaerolineales bacterium]|nr:WecB/TagA/CpsF family glycosyltransferase [Anaerolineales bacterium]
MHPKTNLLGIAVDAIDLPATLQRMEEAIAARRKGLVLLAPAHNLMACRRDAGLRAVFNAAELVVPDGMGTVWFLRLLGRQAGRVYGPDLLQAACQRGLVGGWRHAFVGGSPAANQGLAARLQREHPGLQVAAAFSPPFGELSTANEEALLAEVNASKADIVWVALGSPRQEHWMAAVRPKLNAAWLVGVGAAFDFLSGAKPQAPRWMQRAGLEWLFRLFSEPRRLWRRYAEYPLFACLALGQWLGLLRFEEAG